MPTSIEWVRNPDGTAGETWNPISGCTKISPGCASCYAERISLRFRYSAGPWIPKYEAANVVLHPDRLELPLRWKKPRRIFVNSMSDLFHPLVDDHTIYRVFEVMEEASWHTFQVLTKRPARMLEWAKQASPFGDVASNIWLGVSVENQYWADRRIPLLLQTPAAVRFVSAEPLLGPLDLRPWLSCHNCGGWGSYQMFNRPEPGFGRRCAPCEGKGHLIDWLIVGGESGGKAKRRLVEKCWCNGGVLRDEEFMEAEHCMGTGWRPKMQALRQVRSLRDQASAAGVPFFLKQWGGPRPTSGGRLLDGREWDELPA